MWRNWGIDVKQTELIHILTPLTEEVSTVKHEKLIEVLVLQYHLFKSTQMTRLCDINMSIDKYYRIKIILIK